MSKEIMSPEKKPKKQKIRNTINKMDLHDIKLISNNSKAFEKLVKENPGFVESAVLSVIQRNNQHPEIKDLIQVGLMSLWKAANKYELSKTNGSKFGTFAYKVIQNGVRQELKNLNKREKNTISIEDIRQYNSDSQTGDYKENKFIETRQISYLRNFEDTILTELVIKDQLKHLNTFEREVFNLRFIEKKTIAKIATELKLEENKLKRWYYANGGKQKLELIMNEISK